MVNGQVFYSQHTPGEQNASWDSRQYMPDNGNPANPTHIIIVQPGLDDTIRPSPVRCDGRGQRSIQVIAVNRVCPGTG
jgi:hypothetical protein